MVAKRYCNAGRGPNGAWHRDGGFGHGGNWHGNAQLDCAEQRQLDPRSTFRDLLTEYMHGRIRCPYDEPGRMAAGFTSEEIDDLKAMEAETLARLDKTHA